MSYFKDPDKVLFFDIESSGLFGHRSSTISIAYQQMTGHALPGELYARPEPGTWISKWSENQVWNRVLKRQGQIESEKAILEKFLNVLQVHTKRQGAVIAGWNIGYEAVPQVAGEQRMRGFDIPFLMTRAKQYGLEGKFQEAFGRAKIRDVGAEFAYRIAAEVTTRKDGKYLYESMVDPKLFEQARGFIKGARLQGYQAGDPVSAQARYLAKEGFKFAGWKQESVHKLLGLGEFGAHMAHEDVRAMMDIVGSTKDLKGEAFVREWNQMAVTNKLVASARFGGQRPPELLRAAQAAGVAPQYRQKLVGELRARGMSVKEYWQLGKMPELWSKVGEGGIGPRPPASLAQRGRSLATTALEMAKSNKRWLGAGLGAAALLIAAPLSWFSGSDDAYNTLEGMPEGGVASRMRKIGTDFGSGYQGLPEQLMGQAITPDVLAFRRDVWDVADERREWQAEIRAMEKEAQSKLGVLGESDLFARDLTTMAGINLRDQSLRAIQMDKFALDVEDADTLVLRRRGIIPTIKSWFGYGDVQIRLAGIDAPETASHTGDPLEQARIFQAQPGGEQASYLLKQIVEQEDENLSLTVTTGRKTYGRYLGVLGGEDDLNINLELLRKGAVTALPFGPSSEDILLRQPAARAEERAWTRGEGLWSLARYQAQRIANREIGRDITHNVMTRIDKLGSNLSLGAYASFLEGMGASQRSLSNEEIDQARRMGRALKKTHGPPPAPRFSGKDDAWLKIEGLGHKGIAWQKRRMMTDFGSGWVRNLFGKVTGAVRGTQAKMYAGREVGLGMFGGLRKGALQTIETKGTGETFFLGKQLGEGGLGEVWSAYSAKTSRRAVYKKLHDPTAPALQPGKMIGPGGGAGEVMAMPAAAREAVLSPGQQQAVTKMRGGMTRLSQEMELQVTQQGGMGAIGWETRMQQKASASYGAPRVLGKTNQGFVQEYAGRAIRTKKEAKGAAEFLRKSMQKQMATPGAPLHLDPHLGQVLVNKKGQFSLADWGYSIQTPTQLSSEMREGLTSVLEHNIARGLNDEAVRGLGPRVWDTSILNRLDDIAEGKMVSKPLTGAMESAAPQVYKEMPVMPKMASPAMPGMPAPQMPGMPPAAPPKRGPPTNLQRRVKQQAAHSQAVQQQSYYSATASKGHRHQQGRRKPGQTT